MSAYIALTFREAALADSPFTGRWAEAQEAWYMATIERNAERLVGPSVVECGYGIEGFDDRDYSLDASFGISLERRSYGGKERLSAEEATSFKAAVAGVGKLFKSAGRDLPFWREHESQITWSVAPRVHEISFYLNLESGYSPPWGEDSRGDEVWCADEWNDIALLFLAHAQHRVVEALLDNGIFVGREAAQPQLLDGVEYAPEGFYEDLGIVRPTAESITVWKRRRSLAIAESAVEQARSDLEIAIAAELSPDPASSDEHATMMSRS